MCVLGNEGARMSEAVEYPAQHDNVICVGAHDTYGHESYLSARGDKVDFLCPGEHVASTRSQYRKGFFDYILGSSLVFYLNSVESMFSFTTLILGHLFLLSGISFIVC